jgi:hypothetical protein
LLNGISGLVRVAAIPVTYSGGPVNEIYVASSKEDRVIGIVQAEDSPLYNLGYSPAAVAELLREIVSTAQF